MKGEKYSEGKHSKVRLSGIAAANAYGGKLSIFFISKSKKPRCFSGIRHMLCRYRGQAKSWMSGELFKEWLCELDNKFHHEGWIVVMIIDNCPAHPHTENLKAMVVVFLLKNTTSITQLMNQDIIRSLKATYRTILVCRIMTALITTKPFSDSTFSKPCTFLQQPGTRY